MQFDYMLSVSSMEKKDDPQKRVVLICHKNDRNKEEMLWGGAVNKDCFLKILKMHGFLECSVTSRRNPTAPWFGRMCLLI